jgi:TatD DNase family protein
MKYAFFDIHSHLHDPTFDHDRDQVVKDMKGYGVASITVGTDLLTSRQAVTLSSLHENIYATIGLHPADNPKEEFS